MIDEQKLCQCGCGESLEPVNYKRRQEVRFKVGHHFRLHPEQRGRRPYVPAPGEAPSGLCECGCGNKTNIVTGRTNRKARRFKGYPAARLPGHGDQGSGPNHHNWKGGTYVNVRGYVVEYAKGHPNADKSGYVKQHRLVMERHLGRFLEPWEVVHHINGVKSDNRIENLVLTTHALHTLEHAPHRKYDSERMRAAGRKGAAVRWGKPLPES